jgi:sulfite exporter TauE/SafE
MRYIIDMLAAVWDSYIGRLILLGVLLGWLPCYAMLRVAAALS